MAIDARCSVIAGQIIIAYDNEDWAGGRVVDRLRGEGEGIDDVEYVADIDTRLRQLDLDRTPLAAAFHLALVPEGSEQAAAERIHAAYRRELFYEWDHAQQRRDFPPWERTFFCTPNGLLSLSAVGSPGPADISLAADHATYANLIGFPATIVPTRHPKVVVLDSGVAPSVGITSTAERNFVDGAANPLSAADDNGHGTTVAAIIQALVPQAELIVYKVADANGYASEWDTLCALGASYEADVVNMSLVFGLTTKRCPMCGVKSGTSRSTVFGYLLDELGRRASPPIVVAAAGNDGQSHLMYPARFADVVAVGSVTKDLALSSFSNYGDTDHAQRPHSRRFVLPGGGIGRAGYEEHVATRLQDGKKYVGTSFSAAYASAAIAALRTLTDSAGWPNADLIGHLLDTAVQSPTMARDTTRYGNGLMKLVPPALRPATI